MCQCARVGGGEMAWREERDKLPGGKGEVVIKRTGATGRKGREAC